MSKATVAQVKDIAEDVQKKVEWIITVIQGDPERNVVGIITEIDRLKQRNQFEERIANIAVGIGSALLVFLFTNGCSQILSPTPESTQSVATPYYEATTASVTSSPTTDGALVPSLTPDVFDVDTATPTIIEITPWHVYPSPADMWIPLPSGTVFVPINNLFVRDCRSHEPSVNDNTNPKIMHFVDGEEVPLKAYAGRPIEVFTKYRVWNSPDQWLCIDPPFEDVDKMYMCPRAIAYILGGAPYGELYYGH